MRKIKLEYTEEMKKQDEAYYKNINAARDTTRRLQEDILNEAIEKGFEGFYEMYFIGDEDDGASIVDIYKDKETFEIAYDSDIFDDEDVHYFILKELIDRLEKEINSKTK